MDDEQFGQRLVAYVEKKYDSEHLTKASLLAWLSLRVPRIHLPKEIIFVDELPYTVLGKLDRKLLGSY